jgi:hypothetical protein
VRGQETETAKRRMGETAIRIPLRAAIFPMALLVGLGACAPERPASWVPAPSPPAYQATARVLFEGGGRAASFRAGCAVDPARGLRMEVRDPFGATRLLLILLPHPTGITLVDPARKVRALWSGKSKSLPWIPDALWMALAGEPPAQARIARASGGSLDLRWEFGGTRLKGSLTPASSGPAVFSRTEIHGRGVRLEISLSGAEPRALAPEALDVPDLESYVTTDLWELLPGGTP